MMTMAPLLALKVQSPVAPVSGMRMWFDLTQQIGYVNNDPIGTLTDFSGNGFDLTAGGGIEPLYKTGILNGKPAMLFDGVNDLLAGGVTPFPTGYQHTVFMVLPALPDPPVSPGDYDFLFDCGTDGLDSRRLGYTWKVAGVPMAEFYRDGAGIAGASLAYTAGENVLYAGKFDGASSLFRLNADAGRQASFSASTATTAGVGGLKIGTHNNPAGNYFTGHIAEIIIYDSALSASDFAATEAYLKAKYGIS